MEFYILRPFRYCIQPYRGIFQYVRGNAEGEMVAWEFSTASLYPELTTEGLFIFHELHSSTDRNVSLCRSTSRGQQARAQSSSYCD